MPKITLTAAPTRDMGQGKSWMCQERTQCCNCASMQADRALESKPRSEGVGKVRKPVLVYLWDTPARKLRKALLRLASRQNGIRLWDQSSKSNSRKQQTARPNTVHWWLSPQRPVKVGLHCQARCDYHHVDSAAYWVVQWSWFAWVNALCNLLCKKLHEVTKSLPG